MSDNLFSDWETLVSAVEDKIPDILKNDVAPVAEKLMKKHIKSDIYDVYKPKAGGWVNGTTYQRRNDLQDAVTSRMVDKSTLFITSTATASPAVVKGWSFHNRYDGAFLKLLESGNMGIWRGGFARPAVKNTQTEINESDKITAAIQKGIRKEIGQIL